MAIKTSPALRFPAAACFFTAMRCISVMRFRRARKSSGASMPPVVLMAIGEPLRNWMDRCVLRWVAIRTPVAASCRRPWRISGIGNSARSPERVGSGSGTCPANFRTLSRSWFLSTGLVRNSLTSSSRARP